MVQPELLMKNLVVCSIREIFFASLSGCLCTFIQHAVALMSNFASPFKQLSSCLSATSLLFMLFYWPCCPGGGKCVRISWLNKGVSIHLCNKPTSSLCCRNQRGRLPQTLLTGRHWATSTCHFIINTCCVITDTCFCLHWLFYGDKTECHEWLNAFLRSRHWRQSGVPSTHRRRVPTAAEQLFISISTISSVVGKVEVSSLADC